MSKHKKISKEAKLAIVAGGVILGAMSFHPPTASADEKLPEGKHWKADAEPKMELVSFNGGASCYRQAWSTSVLVKLNVPATPANREALIAWSKAEGGHFKNKAAHNLLNTNRPMKGSWKAIGLDSIQGYPTPEAGVEATVASINLPNFAGIRTALKRGSDTQGVINAAAAAPWAMSHYKGYGWSALRSQARTDLAVSCS